MGDFNCSPSHLAQKYPNLGNLLINCSRSSETTTARSRRNQKLCRELDCIYSSMKLMPHSILLDMEGTDGGTKLSDHKPVLVSLGGKKSTRRLFIPNRSYAKGLTRHILQSSHPIFFSEATKTYRTRLKRYKTVAMRTPW